MREIALDTQAATTVAIIDDGCVLGRAQNDSGRHHAESITPLVREALAAAGLPAQLADAGVDRVLVGTGPAPYWGSYVAAGPDDVTLEGRLEVGDVSALLGAMRTAPGLVVAGAPIPAHSVDALAHVDLGPQVSLDPAVMSRIVATRLSRGEDDRLRTDPLYLRRPDIQGQPTARL